jgi:hypothetical protein
MGIIVPPGYSNARFVFTCDGVVEPMGFSLGMTSVTVGTPLALAEIARQTFKDLVWGFGDAVSNAYTFREVQVATESEGGPVIATAFDGDVGNITAFNPPANCCILLTKITALGGRRNRGRTYIPAGWLFENEVDASGRIQPAAAGAMETRMNNWLAALTLEDVQPVLFHSSAPTTPTPIIGYAASTLIGTQRRRIR